MLKLPGHIRYSYSPIVRRTDYSWPEGKRLAFYIALNIEHFAFGDRDRNGSEQSQPARRRRETSPGATTATGSGIGVCSKSSMSSNCRRRSF